MNGINRILLASILITFVGGCASYRENIGYGLKFIDLSYRNYAIIDSESIFIIYPKISRFCQKDGRIHGFRIDPKGDNSDGTEPFTNNLGYFELDIMTRVTIRKPDLTLKHLEDFCGWKTLLKLRCANAPEYPLEIE